MHASFLSRLLPALCPIPPLLLQIHKLHIPAPLSFTQEEVEGLAPGTDGLMKQVKEGER